MVAYFFVHPRFVAGLEWSINRCLHCKSSSKSWIFVQQPPYRKPHLETARAAKCLAFRLSDMRKPRSFQKNMGGPFRKKVARLPWIKKGELFQDFYQFPYSSQLIHQSPPMFPPTNCSECSKKPAASRVVGIQPANLP